MGWVQVIFIFLRAAVRNQAELAAENLTLWQLIGFCNRLGSLSGWVGEGFSSCWARPYTRSHPKPSPGVSFAHPLHIEGEGWGTPRLGCDLGRLRCGVGGVDHH